MTMLSSVDLLTTAQQIAKEISAHKTALPDVRAEHAIRSSSVLRDLQQRAAPQQLFDAISTLQDHAQKSLDPLPRESFGLARVAYELAGGVAGARIRADTALTLAIVLNRLGDFRDALACAREAASRFEQIAETEQAAHALCQAAWANTFIGDLTAAREDLRGIRENTMTPRLTARGDWIEGRISRDLGKFAQAVTLFEQAREIFRMEHNAVDSARCERELVHNDLIQGKRDSIERLSLARQTFKDHRCDADILLCDHLQSIALQQANEHRQAIQILTALRSRLIEMGMEFFAGWCDNELGINYRHLNEYRAAREAFERTREYFLAHGIPIEVSTVNINLGNLYYNLSDYVGALELYHQALVLSEFEDRASRHALIQGNMGYAYAKQGHFVQAIDLTERALGVAESKTLFVRQGLCYINLAHIYYQLGQFARALGYFELAYKIFSENQLPKYLAECLIQYADLCQMVGETEDAIKGLEEAQQICANQEFNSLGAVAGLALARISGERGERPHALEGIKNSRQVFLTLGQIADAALCDLAEGELDLLGNEITAAQECFLRARKILAPNFREHAWRADYGLARCARSNGDRDAALEHFMQAVYAISETRSELVTEQFSDHYFARWQSLFEEALSAALECQARERALEIIEASKASAFVTLLQNRGWKLRSGHADPRLRELAARERELNDQLRVARERGIAQRGIGQPIQNDKQPDAISVAALDDVRSLNEKYEHIVNELQLHVAGLSGVVKPARFTLKDFRQAANAEFGKAWAALDYYFNGERLVIAILTPRDIRIETKTLSRKDWDALNACIAMTPPAASSSETAGWQHLYDVLLPPDLNATTLIISPHASLHRLAFQALKKDGHYLVERYAITYAPNLQAMQLLLADTSAVPDIRALVCGVSDFKGQLTSLPHSSAEVEQLSALFGDRALCFWEGAATREKMLDLNKTGQLEKFSLLHFTTHIIIDRATPHQSRIVLHEGEITTADVLDLNLNARLVTLSGCQSALGEGGRGDEIVGLARAFFYAGARALVATLSRAEDRSAAKLMSRFYQEWRSGKNIAQALRAAQIEMIHAGRQLYEWAPFVLIGRP